MEAPLQTEADCDEAAALRLQDQYEEEARALREEEEVERERWEQQMADAE